METVTSHTESLEKLRPLFGGGTRKVARKFLACQRLHQRHQSGMECRRVAFSPLNEKGDGTFMYFDVRQGNACFGQSASLVEGNLKAHPHPFRTIFQFMSDDLDLFWGERRFLSGSISLKTQPGYGVRGDVASIQCFIHDKSENSEVYEGSISADNPLREIFRSSPDYIFTGMVALHLVWGGNSGLFPPQTYGTPAGLIFEECFRAIRVVGLEEVWHPLVECVPGPTDKPAIFLLQGQLSDVTLACSCIYPDPDAIFSRLSDYSANFIAVLYPPPATSGSGIFTSHCTETCTDALESQ